MYMSWCYIYKGRPTESTRSSSRAAVESAKHLEFADDIVTCFDTAVDSQRYLSTIEALFFFSQLLFNY